MMNDLTTLIKENESLIYSIIGKYIYYFDKEDLYQVAVLGLINAYKNYKEDKNTKFSSYAYFYIKGEIKKYLRESNSIKISKEIVSLNQKLDEASILLSQKLQKEPTTYELSLFLEIEEDKIIEARKSKFFVSSLDETSEDELDLYNKISVIEKGYDSDILDLKQEIDNLDEEEKILLNERYINDKSQSETAKILNMSQVSVSRKEKDILVRLRTKLM